jgi:hypothetical protein
MEWFRLVESKIRHLVLNLEKNIYINIAHINPTSYEEVVDEQQITKWFVGLDFKKEINCVDLNLTENIQAFTDLVFKQAQKIGFMRPDLSMDAKHVKRKQLKEYLHSSILKLDTKSSKTRSESTSSTTTTTTTTTIIQTCNSSESNTSAQQNKTISDEPSKKIAKKNATRNHEVFFVNEQSPNPYVESIKNVDNLSDVSHSPSSSSLIQKFDQTLSNNLECTVNTESDSTSPTTTYDENSLDAHNVKSNSSNLTSCESSSSLHTNGNDHLTTNDEYNQAVVVNGNGKLLTNGTTTRTSNGGLKRSLSPSQEIQAKKQKDEKANVSIFF